MAIDGWGILDGESLGIYVLLISGIVAFVVQIIQGRRLFVDLIDIEAFTIPRQAN